ncbi:hypothetical protein T05_9801, partial [Trichinella murrelli]
MNDCLLTIISSGTQDKIGLFPVHFRLPRSLSSIIDEMAE